MREIKFYRVIIGIMAIVVFFAFIKAGSEKRQAVRDAGALAVVDARNIQLHVAIIDRDIRLAKKDIHIESLQDSLATSSQRVDSLEAGYDVLESNFEDLEESLQNVPIDTSYRFLTDEAYPYKGQMKYPFNAPQVKGIHLTYLERNTLGEMNITLKDILEEKDYQLMVQDTTVNEQEQKMSLMEETRADLEETVGNKDEEIDIKDSQLKKQKSKKTFWQVATLVIGVIFAAFAAGSG